jgi:hypothetical protein
MRRWAFILIALATAACSPQGRDQNPRDRQGSEGASTWRVVNQSDGQAAFLSRPGAAPDLVLWCRDDQKIVLRAHVFDNPAPQPDLRLTTKGGVMVFSGVRRQGGVRDGDRKLVEGTGLLTDPKVQAVLLAADQLVLQSGTQSFDMTATDPNSVLAGFVAKCTQSINANPSNKK